MIFYKNPQFFFQKLHNVIAKFLIFLARFLGLTCIQLTSALDETNVKGGRIQGLVVIFITVLSIILIVFLDTFVVPVVYQRSIDLVLIYLSALASLVSTIVGSFLPVYKKKEFILAYKTAIALGNSILPLKAHPLMDKKFLKKVATLFLVVILCFFNYSMMIFYGAILMDGELIMVLFRISITIPQFMVLMFPICIILISFTFASHLIKIISMRVRKIVSKIEMLYRQKETNSTNARFMMDCCVLSDDLEYLSECYCKVIKFTNHIFKTIETFILFYCLYIFLLIISQATSFYSGVFGITEEGNIIQMCFFLLTLSLLHFLVYGPQKIIKRSKKLQEIVNSLLLEETEPRLDKSVKTFRYEI